MLEQLFSISHAGKGEIFSNLAIWKEEKYRALQGTYLVISLSFAGVKSQTYEGTKKQIFQIIAKLYDRNNYLLKADILTDQEIKFFHRITEDASENDMAISLQTLCDFM